MDNVDKLCAREIYFLKKGKVLLPSTSPEVQDPNQDSSLALATVSRNLESLGFVFSSQLFRALKPLSTETIHEITAELIPILQESVGAHREYEPFYPNFPQQVMEMGELELYLNALLHYWTATKDSAFLPTTSKEQRPSLDEIGSLRLLHLGDQTDFNRIFTDLVGANASMTETDKRIVAWFIREYREKIDPLLPRAIPQKESLALVIGNMLESLGTVTQGAAAGLRTATDILRTMVIMSDGDVSLASNTKFKSFSRKTRRFFLQALENLSAREEDMLRYPEIWKRAGERLHPGQYQSRYPKTYDAFDVIRNNKPFATFASQVESLLLYRQTAVVDLLQSRPGEFARRLDHLLRAFDDSVSEFIVARFFEVADRVSTPVLMQLHAHFRSRREDLSFRSFFPKGDVAKIQVDETGVRAMPPKLAFQVVEGVETCLMNRFRQLPPMGKVYIDSKKFANYPIPFARRSAAKSLRTLTRGSKMDLPTGDTIRLFIWWKNGDDRVDIDLSGLLFDSTWETTIELTYYNMRAPGCHHSGDIVTAPHGAAEFIDFHVPTLLEQGHRYLMMSVTSFSQQPFCDLPECFAGWMSRVKPGSGEVFEPKTVVDKIDLASSKTLSVPLIFDFEKRQMIWCDVAFSANVAINNVRSNGKQRNGKQLTRIGKALTNLKKPTLDDLLTLHIESRGELVSNPEEADIVFAEHQGITPFDSDAILAEYLA